MSRIQNRVVAASAVALTVVIGTAVSARRADAGSSPNPIPVQIAAPVPLPVTGTVSVGNTPTVTIGGTPGVTVANGPTQPVPTTNRVGPGFQPVSLQPPVTVSANTENGWNGNFYTVPAGKRLVIDYIGAACATPVGENVLGIVVEAMPSSGPATSLAIAPAGSPTVYLDAPQLQAIMVSQKVEMFANAGDSITVGVFTNGGPSGASFANITVNGYLVDSQ